MKKVLAIFAVAAFVACNNSSESTEQKADSTTVTATADSTAAAATTDSTAAKADTTKAADTTKK